MEKLFSMFGVPSLEEWKEIARQELDGDDPDTRLIVSVDDTGFVSSLVRADDVHDSVTADVFRPAPFSLHDQQERDRKSERWRIRFPVTRAELLSEGDFLDLLKECPGAVAEIRMDVSSGLFTETIKEAQAHIRTVQASGIDVSISAGGYPLPVIGFVRAMNPIPGIEVFFDPFHPFLLSTPGTDRETVFGEVEKVFVACKDEPSIRPVVSMDGLPYHRSGASIVQELGFTISAGIDYIRGMKERGLPPFELGTPIRLSYSIGTKFLFEVAKFRAARLLWSAVLGMFGVQPSEKQLFEIHAVTSPWNMTLYDRYTNILRASIEGLAAVMGGVSALSVLPFDGVSDVNGVLAHRLARNTSLIMDHESGLSRVQDPAGGAYVIELLTDHLARSAWGIVQTLEMSGGFLEAYRAGIVTKMIQESSERKREDIACRREIFVGTSKYPDKSERIVRERKSREAAPGTREGEFTTMAVLDDLRKAVRERKNVLAAMEKAFSSGARLSDVITVYRQGLELVESVRPLPCGRGPEPFERVRLAVDKLEERPVAMIIRSGSPSVSRGQAEFASEIFSIAGFDIRETKEEDIEFIVKNTPIRVLVACSDEGTILDAVSRLRECISSYSHKPILVAVSPTGEGIEALRNAGARLCVHPGMNVLNALHCLLEDLSIPID